MKACENAIFWFGDGAVYDTVRDMARDLGDHRICCVPETKQGVGGAGASYWIYETCGVCVCV
jgi:hypothetical protein